MTLKTPIRPAIRGEKFEPGTPAYEAQNAIRATITEETGGPDRSLATIHGQGGHVKRWDPITAGNLDRLEASMSLNPPARAWVVALHPWTISVNGGRMMRDTVPPAALEIFDGDKLAIYRHKTQYTPDLVQGGKNGVGVLEIPWFEPDMKPEENGSYTAMPSLPIEQAGQYAREGNSNDLWGPGVVIYDGDIAPDEMWLANETVSLFDPLGKPQVIQKEENVMPRGSRVPVRRPVDVPITGKFRDVIKQIDEARLARYLILVNEANDNWMTTEGKQKKWYTSLNTRLMAQVLFKMKRIKELPPWAMETNLSAVPAGEKCIHCGEERTAGRLVCSGGWPYDPLAAFEANMVQFDHIAVQGLSGEKLDKVYKLHAHRSEERRKLQEKYAPREKAQPKETKDQ